MRRLNFFGHFLTYSGVAVHSRHFARALADRSDLGLIQLFRPNEPSSGEELGQDLRRRFRAPQPDAPALVFWTPDFYGALAAGYPRRIGYYIFEGTRIPVGHIRAINKLDAVCTASDWGVNILRGNGVSVPCHVVPGGIDPAQFFPVALPDRPEPFRFLSVGKAERRKGIDLLLRAFNEAFQGDPRIRLTLSIDNMFVKGLTSERYVAELTAGLRYPSGNIDIVHFVRDIRSLYHGHHCGVFPARAEGIGLPILEAMACGLPVIASFNSGITEYANDQNAILLKELATEPVFCPFFFPNPGEMGVWESPGVEELTGKMRWVVEHYDEARRIGAQAADHTSRYCTWGHAADRFISLLENCP
jgi:glycosyltransferase involved in cell wall biosynthesis